MKPYYFVITFDDKLFFYNKDTAISCAEMLSTSNNYVDTDIKVVEIQETKIKTFRNGGEVA